MIKDYLILLALSKERIFSLYKSNYIKIRKTNLNILMNIIIIYFIKYELKLKWAFSYF